jgi:four helix bundle protein
MRRSAVSVSRKIAEGKERYSQKELLQFLFRKRFSVGTGDANNLSQELGFLDQGKGPTLTMLATEVGRLLNGLISKFQELVKSA